MKICVIGAGYVGLVSAVCIAEFGHEVFCLDVDAERIEALKRGEVPFYEPGLGELMQKNAQAGRFIFTTDKEKALRNAEVVFIAVGTPMNPSDGSVDLSFVRSACTDMANLLSSDTIVVDKSTVPVGTARMVKRLLVEHGAPDSVEVLSNPEFLREGTAVGDFMKPDRVIIGSDSPKAAKKLAEVYSPLKAEGRPILITTPESAELVKYASNAFLAVKLTFINEIALLADKIGVDALEVAEGIGLDARIGSKFLKPGPGYGGSCLPKDTNGLIHIAKDHGARLTLVETAVETNEDIPKILVAKIAEALGGLRDRSVGVLGLAFKGGTDDVRESPAIKIIKGLLQHGAKVRAFDPQGEKLARRELGESIEYARSMKDAISEVDIVVFATEWPEFGEISPDEMAKSMKGDVVADFRNLQNPEEIKAVGLKYIGMGRV